MKKAQSSSLSRKSKVVAIIQARMGSTRLPGKVLMDIAGHPMLWHVVKRTEAATCIDSVVVATSTGKSDDEIENFCKENKITCFRGSETDVLDRYYQAALKNQADVVFRITSDCPLVDPQVLDTIAERYFESSCDYASNTIRYTYPEGLDAELFSMAALTQAHQEAKEKSDREHVTPFIKNSRHFKKVSVENSDDYSQDNYHWSVDRKSDLEFVQNVFNSIKNHSNFGFNEVLKLIKKKPKLRLINGGQVINEGYYKSLYEGARSGSASKISIKKSQAWFARSQKVIPLASQTFSKSYLQYVQGVSPLFLQKGKGYRVTDVDGNEFIDYVQGLLPNILGYCEPNVTKAAKIQLDEGHSFSLPHPLEVELAERLVSLIPCAEMVRFGKNGTDVTSAAIRVSRAFTGRERVAVCGYHGWQDWYIGSTTRNLGVPKAVQGLTHTFPYNDVAGLEKVLSEHKGEFAAVIMEPMNFVEPQPGYLEAVKATAKKHGAVFVFDEICSGFMFGLGGLQKAFGVIPDLACFGKAMGNGFPISCIVGKKEIMNLFEEIFYSGTFGGEAQSMAASLKVLEILESTDALKIMEYQGRVLQDGFNALAKEAGLGDRFQAVGRPQWSLLKFKDAAGKDSLLERSLFQQEAIKRGILMLATHNMTAAHDSVSTEMTLKAYASVFKTLSQWLSDTKPEKYLEGEMIRPVFRVR